MSSSPRRVRRIVINPETVKAFLASDAGRRFRRVVAGGLVVAAPLMLRIPIIRRHPLLRWLELLGGVALIVKLAEALRDWEPATPIVLDVDA